MSAFELKEAPHAKVKGPLLVVVMDGVGMSSIETGNALAQAHTPTLTRLKQEHLFSSLQAHGHAVGMPTNKDMGNSEVGHNTLGAGRIFDQGATLVEQAIHSGSLRKGPVWMELLRHCLHHNTPLHLIGLLSDGNVHSHIKHLLYLVREADKENLREVYIHALLDGRDVNPQSAHLYIHELEELLSNINRNPNRRYKIASGGGRMTTTMDRYGANWSMVEKGWQTHVCGEGKQFASALDALHFFRKTNPSIYDQDLPAFVIAEKGKAVGPINDGAAVVAFNFRGDRMLELCHAFAHKEMKQFAKTKHPQIMFVAMTLYDGDTLTPERYLVSPPEIDSTLGELLARRGKKQFACSETQKFGHVTYFWNGNRSSKFSPKLESYIEIPSHNGPFDQNPEMRAAEITQQVIHECQKKPFDFGRINYANGDMVGHTGNFDATVNAIEVLDQNIALLVEHIFAQKGALIITADHGNAEEMLELDKINMKPRLNSSGEVIPKTSHSLNPVPCFICLPPELRSAFALNTQQDKGIANIAATAAMLMGYMPPEIYAPSLLNPLKV